MPLCLLLGNCHVHRFPQCWVFGGKFVCSVCFGISDVLGHLSSLQPHSSDLCICVTSPYGFLYARACTAWHHDVFCFVLLVCCFWTRLPLILAPFNRPRSVTSAKSERTWRSTRRVRPPASWPRLKNRRQGLSSWRGRLKKSDGTSRCSWNAPTCHVPTTSRGSRWLCR